MTHQRALVAAFFAAGATSLLMVVDTAQAQSSKPASGPDTNQKATPATNAPPPNLQFLRSNSTSKLTNRPVDLLLCSALTPQIAVDCMQRVNNNCNGSDMLCICPTIHAVLDTCFRAEMLEERCGREVVQVREDYRLEVIANCERNGIAVKQVEPSGAETSAQAGSAMLVVAMMGALVL